VQLIQVQPGYAFPPTGREKRQRCDLPSEAALALGKLTRDTPVVNLPPLEVVMSSLQSLPLTGVACGKDDAALIIALAQMSEMTRIYIGCTKGKYLGDLSL
jgi:hypothetical protein